MRRFVTRLLGALAIVVLCLAAISAIRRVTMVPKKPRVNRDDHKLYRTRLTAALIAMFVLGAMMDPETRKQFFALLLRLLHF